MSRKPTPPTPPKRSPPPNPPRASRAGKSTSRKSAPIARPGPSGLAGPARFAGLDGLRAIAVLTVIAFHLTPGALTGGYLGVDLFFVISGFLITALLLREREKTGRIRLFDFWRRRARRLLPALGILLLACCSAALLVGGNVLVGLGRQVLGAATFSSNWLSIAGEHSYFTESNPELFRNLWSLAVEEQFYLIWPLALLALLFVPRRSIRVGIVAVVAIGSAVAMALLHLPGGDATRVYYGTDTHSFGLAIGAVLALASQRWSTGPLSTPLGWSRWLRAAIPVIGLAAIGALLVLTVIMPADEPFAYRGGLALVSLLTAIAIAGAVLPGSLLGRGLDAQPLRWIGERSYGLYLWHWPVFVLVAASLPNLAPEGTGVWEPGAWAIGGIAFAITVVAAALSYRFVEQPIRRNGFRAAFRAWFTGWWQSFPRLAAGLVTLCLVAVAGTASVSAITSDPGETDAQAIIEAGAAAIAPPPPPAVDTGKAPSAPPPVELPSGEQIYALGDSVMLASAPQLQRAFPGIAIDATVSRQLSSAPALVQALKDKGKLRPTLLLGLGTNGPIDKASLERIRRILGPSHQLILVSVQAPRGWTPGVNSTLAVFAQQYRNVELANWRDAIAGHLSLLARDRIHPGDAGGKIYAGTVRDALQRLAELPPVLSANEYGLAPHPL
ncbi:MAG TPA: acyltransferase family protein [Terrimesophilobacter sp.]|nr:acyltransferase family protein [Terrimesophilobacter sp.]